VDASTTSTASRRFAIALDLGKARPGCRRLNIAAGQRLAASDHAAEGIRHPASSKPAAIAQHASAWPPHWGADGADRHTPHDRRNALAAAQGDKVQKLPMTIDPLGAIPRNAEETAGTDDLLPARLCEGRLGSEIGSHASQGSYPGFQVRCAVDGVAAHIGAAAAARCVGMVRLPSRKQAQRGNSGSRGMKQGLGKLDGQNSRDGPRNRSRIAGAGGRRGCRRG